MDLAKQERRRKAAASRGRALKAAVMDRAVKTFVLTPVAGLAPKAKHAAKAIVRAVRHRRICAPRDRVMVLRGSRGAAAMCAAKDRKARRSEMRHRRNITGMVPDRECVMGGIVLLKDRGRTSVVAARVRRGNRAPSAGRTARRGRWRWDRVWTHGRDRHAGISVRGSFATNSARAGCKAGQGSFTHRGLAQIGKDRGRCSGHISTGRKAGDRVSFAAQRERVNTAGSVGPKGRAKTVTFGCKVRIFPTCSRPRNA